ncbi:hypothetical protein PGTUg99_033442 [Puccinia graminis f. sp. tritici]|uniref:Uncharacterized protein n=1 Tax=Puccinia graminis f. sp. tritici TaxID=56615 RepID=A0A5B0SEE6_PUCGR|nr:hypothetical protein PGTUg99_033442 [Puccinia graminis f. sp. tritici]
MIARLITYDREIRNRMIARLETYDREIRSRMIARFVIDHVGGFSWKWNRLERSGGFNKAYLYLQLSNDPNRFAFEVLI